MKQVICLYRGATAEETEKQKTACHIYAGLQGWDIRKEYFGFGRNQAADPDALTAVRNAALNREFDTLLVYEYNNIGRFEQETPMAISWFIQNNIDVVSVKHENRDFENEVLQIIKQNNISIYK
ncbi:MAG: recombinase family protein [Candidatus Ornithomonoglobus sp.]